MSEHDDQEKARALPDPSGYRILCAVPDTEDTYASGLIKADDTKRYEALLSTVLFVLKMGPECYEDKDKFPSGPWCKEGDFVIVRPNAGARIKVHGKEFRIIYDDMVEAVVQDPRGITRN